MKAAKHKLVSAVAGSVNFIFFYSFVLLYSPMLSADTLDVAAGYEFSTVIMNDTLPGGGRDPERVYRLKRDSVYLVTHTLYINGSFTLVAERGTGRPPVISWGIVPDAAIYDHFFEFTAKGSRVNIRGVYFDSNRQGYLGWSDGMRITADSISLTIDSVIFDNYAAGKIVITGNWNKTSIRNCIFRNNIWSINTGNAYNGGWTFFNYSQVQDTLIFRDNTFFCHNNLVWSVRNYCTYALFDHNTVVYTMLTPFYTMKAQNLHITNNIFYSAQSFGGTPAMIIKGEMRNFPDTVSASIIQINAKDTVSSWYNLWGKPLLSGPEIFINDTIGITTGMVEPSKRIIEIKNNSYYWPEKLFDFISAYNDTVTMYDNVPVPDYSEEGDTASLKRILYQPQWINGYSQMVVDSILLPAGADIDISNNFNSDPGFAPGINNHIDNVISYIKKMTQNSEDLAGGWFYPGFPEFPPVWPLAENFRYTNSALQHAGTDGLALGDLNWFPEQRVVSVPDSRPGIVQDFYLADAYPNPFNPVTKIKFSVPYKVLVKVILYDLLGRAIMTILNEEITSGNHEIIINGSNLSSGVYFCTLEAAGFIKTKKIVLLK